MKLPTKTAIFLTFKINENITIAPGQYILLQVSNLSTLEWHPFTITDFVIEPKRTVFTLAIKVRGDWTNELYQKIFNLKLHSEQSKRRRSKNRRRNKVPAPRKLAFVLDGPFPSPMESILANERVILIGAGIGVTPYISIFNYIMWVDFIFAQPFQYQNVPLILGRRRGPSRWNESTFFGSLATLNSFLYFLIHSASWIKWFVKFRFAGINLRNLILMAILVVLER